MGMRQSHTLLLLRGGLHQNHAPLPHIGEEMFKKVGEGLEKGCLSVIGGKANCGKFTYIYRELTDKEKKANVSKPLQNSSMKTNQD